ncbi:MAG: redox-regulated ATPase YchF [Acidobacteriota bacterium]|nr:redox-regulated ATPase YchF [Acidobacteriota bacterium]MDH3524337.1 redox-regulated ATPase YchF [Acidobacteriota bacterium]
MQMGILGLPKAGKTTLFNLLTASAESTDKFAKSRDAHLGVAQVPDARLARLRDLFAPRRYVPATVQFVDVPGIQKGQGSANLDLVKLREVDALVHVVRCFEDEELAHVEGSVDPRRDVADVDLELILADLELVERRLERLEQSSKRGLRPEEVRERELLQGTLLPALEAERPLREVALADEDEKRLRGFQLLSAKPLLVVLNVGEEDLRRDPESLLGTALGTATRTVVMSAPIEQEIAQLPAAEALAFLEDLGLSEPSVDRVIRTSYDLLGRISFFTVGEDEVRAWTIRRHTTARAAAGAVHSDIERGFIRAEVVAADLLLARRSLAACREHGELRLEGKEYEVQDGEVVHFRFNV